MPAEAGLMPDSIARAAPSALPESAPVCYGITFEPTADKSLSRPVTVTALTAK